MDWLSGAPFDTVFFILTEPYMMVKKESKDWSKDSLKGPKMETSSSDAVHHSLRARTDILILSLNNNAQLRKIYINVQTARAGG